MILLPNNCSCSELKVFPKNWQTLKANVKLPWHIHYRFYDPTFKDDPRIKGKKLKIIKGMNQFSTLKARQDATRALLNNELFILLNQSYNPITGKIEQVIEHVDGNEALIDPDTPFIKALWRAAECLKKAPSTMRDIGTIIRGVSVAANRLRMTAIPVNQITRKHIKAILRQCEKDNKSWSANRFNTYRSYLMILFSELFEAEATEIDPVTKIKKQKAVKRIRQRLTLDERSKVSAHLKQNHYPFWRFMQIFFHSAARESELVQVRKEDVDLNNQRYKMIIKKGKQYREIWRTIKDLALPLWQELSEQAEPKQFLFSKFLRPGDQAINSNQITRRWNVHVKKKLGINADFYSLKHSNLDETAALLSATDAQRMAAHTSLVVTMDHYLGGEKEREHDRLKSVKNTL